MRTIAVLMAVAVTVAGCGGDDDPVSPDVFTVIVAPPTSTTIAVGESVQLTATARDAEGDPVPNATITWSSAAPTVLGVSPSGRILGIAPGIASITASSDGVTSAPMQLAVTAAPTVGAVVLATSGNQFVPAAATISVGRSVVFGFLSTVAHNVTFDAVPQTAPTNIPTVQDQVVSRTFAATGTFPYRCTIHPGMNGQIVVNP